MTVALSLPSLPARSGLSLGLHLRASTAIRRYRPDELSPFNLPEIAWRRSPTGMVLIQLGASDEEDRVLLILDGHWPTVRDPWHAIAPMLEEAELAYEAYRVMQDRWALQVQPEHTALGLPPGEEGWHGGGRHYGVAAIDQLRTALRGADNRPLAPRALVRAREIVAAWDRHQAADVLALARSGLAIWRRIAAEACYDSMSLGHMTRQASTFSERVLLSDLRAIPMVRIAGCSKCGSWECTSGLTEISVRPLEDARKGWS